MQEDPKPSLANMLASKPHNGATSVSLSMATAAEYTRRRVVNEARALADRMKELADALDANADATVNGMGEVQRSTVDVLCARFVAERDAFNTQVRREQKAAQRMAATIARKEAAGTKRKPFAGDAGYVASRKADQDTWLVIYDRQKGGDWIDADQRWVLASFRREDDACTSAANLGLCDFTSLALAREAMKDAATDPGSYWRSRLNLPVSLS